jgi:serine phosphatase RsbU (regulator of sigma subunit)
VEPGEALVIVTDGLVERADPEGRPFDDAGVEEVVKELLGRPAPEILDRLFDAALVHGGRRPWLDDTTALVAVREA